MIRLKSVLISFFLGLAVAVSTPGISYGGSLCHKLFETKTSRAQSQLDPDTGTGWVIFRTRDWLGDDMAEEIFEELPNMLTSRLLGPDFRARKSKRELLKYLSPLQISSLLNFANSLEAKTNRSVSKSERGKIKLVSAQLLKTDGSVALSPGSSRHEDAAYFVATTVFKGSTTKRVDPVTDEEIPTPLADTFLFSGSLRALAFAKKLFGKMARLQDAPEGARATTHVGGRRREPRWMIVWKFEFVNEARVN